jgi:phage terminase large subunit
VKVTEVFWKNLKAYKDGYTTIINKGGSGSSKTGSLIQLQDFIAAHSKRHRKISIVSQTFPHLKDGVIYEYDKYMMRDGFKRKLNKADHEYHINNSIINYFSLDDPGKAVGPSRDILWLNEPNRGISFESFTQLDNRTDECVFIDYNPSHKWWLQTEGVLDRPKTIVIHSTWLDNIENLSRKRIDYFLEAKRQSKTSPYWDYWWKVYGLGQDGILLEERIMPFVNKCSKVPDDAIQIPNGLDFGFFPDPTCFVQLWVRPRKITGKLRDELYIKQIVYDTKLSIDSASIDAKNLCTILKDKGVNPAHLTIAECADSRALNDMRMAGFSIEAVKKTSVETSIRKFHEYDIYIVDGSEEVFNEFENYKYARDKRTNEILGVPAERQADHSIDGTRYVLLSRDFRWSI